MVQRGHQIKEGKVPPEEDLIDGHCQLNAADHLIATWGGRDRRDGHVGSREGQ